MISGCDMSVRMKYSVQAAGYGSVIIKIVRSNVNIMKVMNICRTPGIPLSWIGAPRKMWIKLPMLRVGGRLLAPIS